MRRSKSHKRQSGTDNVGLDPPVENVTPRKRAKSERSRLVDPRSIQSWKELLECVLDSDSNRKISFDLFGAAAEQLSAATESELGQDLPQLLRDLVALLPDLPRLHVAGFIFCCHVLDVSPSVPGLLPPILSQDSPVAQHFPRRHGLDYEHVLLQLLVVLREAQLGDPVRVEIREGQSFLKWLQHLGKFIHDNSLPVPVTDVTVQCVQALLDIHPLCVEPLIGQLCAVFLYNIDHVNVADFWEHVLTTYLKLRQVPKLIAKLLIAVGKTDDKLKVVPLSQQIRLSFAKVVGLLPAGQVLEVWRTFLYHLESDCLGECGNSSKATNMLGLIDQLMGVFLRHVCVIDHTVPKPTVNKVCELMGQTQEKVLSKLGKGSMRESRLQLAELAVLLAINRDRQFPDIFGVDCGDKVVQLKIDVVQATGKGEKMKVDLDPEDIVTYGLLDRSSADKVLEISKSLVAREKSALGESLKKSPLLQESVKLQTGIVVNVLKYLTDVLDVDSNCEEILKPFSKEAAAALLQDLDDPATMDKIKRVYNLLEASMTGDRTNPELDAKFYFHVPLDALEPLPLESLHPTLNLLVLAVTFSLLSVSSHEDVNERLFVILARCLDPTFRQSHLTRLANPAKIVTWLSRLRYYQEQQYVCLAQKSLCQSLVKNIREFSDAWPQFSDTLDKLAPPLKTMENDKSVASAVILMEVLEQPLRHRDAAGEKIKACEKHFNALSKSLLSGLDEFRDHSEDKKFMVVRALTSVFVVWGGKADSDYPMKVKSKWTQGIGEVTGFALEHLHRRESRASRLAIAGLQLSGPKETCLVDDFRERLWMAVTDLKAQVSDFEALVICLIEKSDLASMKKYMLELFAPPLKVTDSLEDYKRLTKILQCFALANVDEEKSHFRQKLLEEALPELQRICQENKCYESNLSMKMACMELQLTLLKAKKPLILRESEARCLVTCLQLKTEEVLMHSSHFYVVWETTYEILSAALLNRTNSLIIPRIPVVIAIFRNLLAGLCRASDQKRNVTTDELKKLVAFAQNMGRVLNRLAKMKEDFARVAPYLIADILSYFQQFTIYPEVKTNLTFGIHRLLDICDKHATEFLDGTLPDGAKEMYKHVHGNYQQYYKFSGRV